MTLTKHLYELDEVVSALQICLRNGWPRGLFWLWELVVSREEEKAHDTLTTAWLYWGGGYDPHSLSEKDWVRRYLRIAATIRAAGSLHALRLLATEANRPSMTPLASRKGKERRRIRSAAFVSLVQGSKEAANFWISYDSACRQGSRKDALWLLQAAQDRLSADAIWSAIGIAVRGSAITKEAIALIQSASPTSQILYQAAATLLLCMSTAIREEMIVVRQPISRVHQEQWDSWSAAVGRSARMYPIPPEAIHRETTRGQIAHKYTNIGDLRDPIVLLAEGCQFWRSALEECGITQDAETGATIFPDDDVLEGFYDRYFPDDIPDEWSKAEQEKSHGRGCQETAVEPFCVPRMSFSALAWKHGIHVRG